MRRAFRAIPMLAFALLLACGQVLRGQAPPPSPAPGTPVQGYRVVRTFPHDTSAFTQGLVFDGGKFYESTGEYGQSSLREVEIESGKILRQRKVDAAYFAEGLALVGDRLVQLTWTTGVGLVWNKADFAPVGEFYYSTEGWGLAFDTGRDRLVMSDGTATLQMLDPRTLKRTEKLDVRDQGAPVAQLNELEIVCGEIWANVWQTDWVVRIDPVSGHALGWINLSGLLPPEERTGEVDVLNGIAWDPATGRLFVTGKNWPKVFEVEIEK